jgi:hypothetical protein
MTQIKIISILNDTNDCLCMFSVRFVFKERDIRAICILNHINDYLSMFSVRLSKDLNMVNLYIYSMICNNVIISFLMMTKE